MVPSEVGVSGGRNDEGSGRNGHQRHRATVSRGSVAKHDKDRGKD